MVSPRIAVVDYGAGNLRSVGKALERAGLAVEVTGEPSALAHADALALPGVGAFADAMASLRARALVEPIVQWLASGRPYLGLCLGLQLLFEESDEHGRTQGFGAFRGRVPRFPDRTPSGERLRVPHIGWNRVRWSGDHPMLRSLDASDCYYFVHSYYAAPSDPSLVVGRADYPEPFAAAVAREGIFAVQFHPEKSQTAGARVLASFADWVRAC